MAIQKSAVERELDALLRGEIAAAESYELAISGIDDSVSTTKLRAIQDDHGAAIRYFYEQISERGVGPSTHSGPWGAFARTVARAATVVGDRTALRALREGEMRGLDGYESVLHGGRLPSEIQDHVTDRIVPRIRDHIETLQQMIDA